MTPEEALKADRDQFIEDLTWAMLEGLDHDALVTTARGYYVNIFEHEQDKWLLRAYHLNEARLTKIKDK